MHTHARAGADIEQTRSVGAAEQQSNADAAQWRRLLVSLKKLIEEMVSKRPQVSQRVVQHRQLANTAQTFDLSLSLSLSLSLALALACSSNRTATTSVAAKPHLRTRSHA